MPVMAGELRQSVSISHRSLGTADETGAQPESYGAAVTPTRAEVRLLSGSEGYRAKQVHADATYQVRIRYDVDVLVTDRITWGSLYLWPLSITHDPLKREMVILCRQSQ